VPAEKLYGLSQDTSYEYLLAYKVGAQLGWYDAEGVSNGSHFSTFRTRQAPVYGAQPSRSFGNAVGVGTRTGYSGTPFGDLAQVKAKLLELGVRFIRDSGHPSWRTDALQLYRELSDAGLRITTSFGGIDDDQNNACDS
jgi:hypothetical protein